MPVPKSAMKLLCYSPRAMAVQLAQKRSTNSWPREFQQLKDIFSTVCTNLCIWLNTLCLEVYDTSAEQRREARGSRYLNDNGTTVVRRKCKYRVYRLKGNLPSDSYVLAQKNPW